MLKLAYDSKQTFIFSSEAIAIIIGKDHQDLKEEIQNIHLTDFAKAYATTEDGNYFTHDYWIGNFNQMEDGTILMTEGGLWFYLWSLEDMPSPAKLESIISYVNNRKSQVYHQSMADIIKRIKKASGLMVDAMSRMSRLQRPGNLIGEDMMPETISAVKRMMNAA
jgi:hypothetical protein